MAEAKDGNRRQRRAKAVEAAPVPATPAEHRKLDAYHAAAEAMKQLDLPAGERDAQLKSMAEKCGLDVMAVEVWKPYGGARSFDELDTYMRGSRIRQQYDELNYQLRSLMGNVLDDESLNDGQRARAIMDLAEEFAARAEDVPDDVDDAIAAGARETTDPTPTAGTFRAFKEADTWRWFAVYSNPIRDKTGERFPAQAHKDFVRWVDQDEAARMPELWDWHTPVGAAFYPPASGKRGMGRADFLDYQEPFAIAAGYFYPEFNDSAERLGAAKDLGVSHGYQYHPIAGLDQTTKEYRHYFTFEISPLPRSKAANDITLFLPDNGAKEDIMELRSDRRQHLVAIHGEGKVKAIESALETASAGLKDEGISFKDLEDALASAAPSAAPAASGSVPPVAAPAGGDQTAAGVKALTDAIAPAITAAVKDAVAPIETRLVALEGNFKERLDAAMANAFGPRFQPDPSKSPSADPDNVWNGNRKEVQQAVKSGAEPDLEGVPDHLAFYIKNAPGLFGAGVMPSAVDAMIQAAGQPTPAGV